MLSGYYHVAALVFVLIIIGFYLKIHIKNYKFISFKYSINWIEEKNFHNINPMMAVRDKPVEPYYNKSLWDSHLQQSKTQIKDINYFFPEIDFNSVDPLRTRLLVILFFIISLFWGTSNNVIERNIFKIFQITFNEKQLTVESLNILAWIDPPSYTGLSQINIDIKSIKDEATDKCPFFE